MKNRINNFRKKLKHKYSIGTWMQIPSSSVAEILSAQGYDWITVDLEHGSFALNQLPDIFRSIELGGSLGFARISNKTTHGISSILDSGASGLILSNIETPQELLEIVANATYPPRGKRGVGFSRANLFGKNFSNYSKLSQKPIIIPMIESVIGANNLELMIKSTNVDAIFIGPYDLSASLGICGKFDDRLYLNTIKKILEISNKYKVPAGIHVINPSKKELNNKIKEGYKLIAYSIDAYILTKYSEVQI